MMMLQRSSRARDPGDVGKALLPVNGDIAYYTETHLRNLRDESAASSRRQTGGLDPGLARPRDGCAPRRAAFDRKSGGFLQPGPHGHCTFLCCSVILKSAKADVHCGTARILIGNFYVISLTTLLRFLQPFCLLILLYKAIEKRFAEISILIVQLLCFFV